MDRLKTFLQLAGLNALAAGLGILALLMGLVVVEYWIAEPNKGWVFVSLMLFMGSVFSLVGGYLGYRFFYARLGQVDKNGE